MLTALLFSSAHAGLAPCEVVLAEHGCAPSAVCRTVERQGGFSVGDVTVEFERLRRPRRFVLCVPEPPPHPIAVAVPLAVALGTWGYCVSLNGDNLVDVCDRGPHADLAVSIERLPPEWPAVPGGGVTVSFANVDRRTVLIKYQKAK